MSLGMLVTSCWSHPWSEHSRGTRHPTPRWYRAATPRKARLGWETPGTALSLPFGTGGATLAPQPSHSDPDRGKGWMEGKPAPTETRQGPGSPSSEKAGQGEASRPHSPGPLRQGSGTEGPALGPALEHRSQQMGWPPPGPREGDAQAGLEQPDTGTPGHRHRPDTGTAPGHWHPRAGPRRGPARPAPPGKATPLPAAALTSESLRGGRAKSRPLPGAAAPPRPLLFPGTGTGPGPGPPLGSMSATPPRRALARTHPLLSRERQGEPGQRRRHVGSGTWGSTGVSGGCDAAPPAAPAAPPWRPRHGRHCPPPAATDGATHGRAAGSAPARPSWVWRGPGSGHARCGSSALASGPGAGGRHVGSGRNRQIPA